MVVDGYSLTLSMEKYGCVGELCFGGNEDFVSHLWFVDDIYCIFLIFLFEEVRSLLTYCKSLS